MTSRVVIAEITPVGLERLREAAPAPVETPAAAEYEDSGSEHSFEVPRVYPEAPEKEELDIPPFLR